jgi:hypothetical protein
MGGETWGDRKATEGNKEIQERLLCSSYYRSIKYISSYIGYQQK